LLVANITELVKQKEGTIFKTHRRMSPTLSVDGIILSMNTTIPPIPANTKCINIVIVYEILSEVKKNDST
jgi:hypothetical protein